MIEVRKVVSDSKSTRLRKVLQEEFFDKHSELYAVNYICESLNMEPFTLMDFMRGDDSTMINTIEFNSLTNLLGLDAVNYIYDWKNIHETRTNT